MSDSPIFIDMTDPEARRWVWLAQVRGRLSIELGTGLRFKGRGILKIMQEHPECGIKFMRKREALVWVWEEQGKIIRAREAQAVEGS